MPAQHRELVIHCPDGQIKTVPLVGGRLSVGRSSTAEISFPEDSGLSRQHFAFESEGDDWTVCDLNSKNGTFVNNIPLKAKLVLTPGDRITAGHITAVYAPAAGNKETGPRLVIFEGDDSTAPTSSTVVTSLEGANKTVVFDRTGAGAKPSAALQSLIRAGQELAVNRPLAELFPQILDLAIEAVNAQRGVVLTLEGEILVPRAHKGEGFRISTAVRDRVVNQKSSILVRNAQLDDAFRSRQSIVEQKVHTMMAVPLQTKERIIGLIYVDSPFVLREFTESDLSLLTVMANVAAIRIENVRLAEIEQQERIMKRDLAQAADIQRRILPERAPAIRGLDVSGFNMACRTVGGDYYGFFPYPDGRMALALGDVSGKGMPAALLVMQLQARLEALAEDPCDLSALMLRLNKITCANCPSNRFITFFMSLVNPATGDLSFANAGHNPPIIVRASGDIEMLEGGGPVLGVLPIAKYGEQHARLGKGDLLVIYSDGVTEANDLAEEEYGEERLTSELRKHRGESAETIVRAITESVSKFAEGAPQADDITLIVAKRT
jgi:serine phosphatase RsbU (regulator of sigma subunit)